MTKPSSTLRKIALALLPAALLGLLAISVTDLGVTQWLFVHTTYYFLLTSVLVWVGTELHAAGELRRAAAAVWMKENWPGLVVALVVTAVAGLAVEPALRVLSDEANLVGTSKNFFATKTATFTVSGKYYYGSYWDIDVSIDRRPTLFPFLVSLIHAARGYAYENVFLFNLLVLPAFVLVSYRLAKSLAGETFGVVAALLVAAHPITLISVRSGGFDFFATFFALLVVKSTLDYVREQSPGRLALLWLKVCLFAEVRYESALFLLPVLAALLLFGLIRWRTLRPYAFVYALTPVYLLPRFWQSLLRGNVPEQEPGTVAFSAENFLRNAGEYFAPLLAPAGSHSAHSTIVIVLGVVGSLYWLVWLGRRARARDWTAKELRFGVFVLGWMLLQTIISFSYVWGRAQFPSAARLFLPIDTFLSLTAAWVLARSLERFRPFVAVLVAAGLFVREVPVASQHRLLNRLTQTRENAVTWEFFERLGEKRILIVTDRPNHFTIMNYGAMNFATARSDPYLFTALARRLFQEVYVIQQIKLSTNAPLPGYELWPDRKLEPVLEFQNDADVLVRVSRVAR